MCLFAQTRQSKHVTSQFRLMAYIWAFERNLYQLASET